MRSLQNLPHGRVFAVAPSLPEWVTSKVIHIPWEQRKGKWADLSAKFKELHAFPTSPDIYHMDDDQYILRPVRKIVPFHNGWLENVKEKAVVKPYTNAYHHLKRNGIARPKHCQAHVPFPMTRKKIDPAWDDGQGPYDWKMLYFNYHMYNRKFKLGENKVLTEDALYRTLRKNPKVISSEENVLMESRIAHYLSYAFPHPSKYEQHI